MTLAFHPLADLFPLIEGTEFDELATSIKENGLLEPITMLNGAILDGRNRYRACVAADVQPRFEEFAGRDLVQFVICKNIQRRHLNETQRGLLAARFATLDRGNPAFRKDPNTDKSAFEIKPLTIPQAAELFNVSEDLVSYGKKVLREGSDAEIEAVRTGSAALTTVAREIARNPKADERPDPIKSRADKRAVRVNGHQMQADIWCRLRDALENLTSLPLPSEVAAIASIQDKKTKGAAVERKLAPAIEWLTEFSNAWNGRSD